MAGEKQDLLQPGLGSGMSQGAQIVEMQLFALPAINRYKREHLATAPILVPSQRRLYRSLK